MVPDSQGPDVNRLWPLRPQAVSRGNHVVADGPIARVHVYGYDLSVMVVFDLAADVPLVYLVAQLGDLL